MKQKILLGTAAIAAAFLFTACDGSRDVAEKFLQASLDEDSVAIRKLTKNNDSGKRFVITGKEKKGNEAVYTYRIENQDGSVAENNQKLVVFKDKNIDQWLVDLKRTEEEQRKTDKSGK